jgi:hypothetical protein
MGGVYGRCVWESVGEEYERDACVIYRSSSSRAMRMHVATT